MVNQEILQLIKSGQNVIFIARLLSPDIPFREFVESLDSDVFEIQPARRLVSYKNHTGTGGFAEFVSLTDFLDRTLWQCGFSKVFFTKNGQVDDKIIMTIANNFTWV